MAISAISSVSLLKREIDKFNHVLSVPETEDTWESLSKGIQFFTVICKNGACDWPEELVPALRLLALPLIGAMSSERTRLSGVAIDLIASVASGLGCIFEPLLQIFFPVLLTLSGRTNKVIVTRARACISVIIETTQLPSILPYFLQSMKDKSTSLRLTAAEGTLTCMNCFNPPDLEKDTRAREVESVIRATARDANADIRKVSRKIFDAYKLLLPDRVDSFTGPLTPTMKKYLDIKSQKSQSQSTITNLIPNFGAGSILSASTSAIHSIQRPAQPQFQAQHFRSVSSPVIATQEGLGETTKPVRRAPEKSDMPPPPYVPIRPNQHSHIILVSQSVAHSRKRAVSTSRSTVEQVGISKVAIPPVHPSRPASASGLRGPPHRPSSNLAPQLGSQVSVVSGPRRVPLPEVSKRAALSSARVTTSTSSSQPGLKPTRNESSSTCKPDEVRSTVRRADPRSSNKPNSLGSAVTVAVVVERNSKARGATQPTLAQLARTRPAVERKAPSAVVSKPLWGGRPLSKTAVKKTVPGQPIPRQISIPLEAAPQPPLEERSTTPTQILLPPSPSSVHQVVSRSRSATLVDSPPSAPLPAPVELSLEDENCGEDIETERFDQHTSNETLCGVKIVAPIINQCAPDSNFSDKNPVVDGIVTQKNVQEVTTPRGLPNSENNLDLASNKTPISTLLSSIQRGFLFTPSSPLSPPQSYLSQGPALEERKDLAIPFPLHINGTHSSDGGNIQENKKFVFGVVSSNEASRHTLGSVENLDIL